MSLINHWEVVLNLGERFSDTNYCVQGHTVRNGRFGIPDHCCRFPARSAFHAMPTSSISAEGSLGPKQVWLVYWCHCLPWVANSLLLPVPALHTLNVPESALLGTTKPLCVCPPCLLSLAPCSISETYHTVLSNVGYHSWDWFFYLVNALCSPKIDCHVTWVFSFLKISHHRISTIYYHHRNQYHLLTYHACIQHPIRSLTPASSIFTSAL